METTNTMFVAIKLCVNTKMILNHTYEYFDIFNCAVYSETFYKHNPSYLFICRCPKL